MLPEPTVTQWSPALTPCSTISGAESLRAETADVNARGCGCDHLDRAAGKAELRRPDGVAAAPADHLAQGRREDVPAQRFGERLYSQSSPPFFQMWASAMRRIPMKTSISMRPNHLSWRSSTAQG